MNVACSALFAITIGVGIVNTGAQAESSSRQLPYGYGDGLSEKNSNHVNNKNEARQANLSNYNRAQTAALFRKTADQYVQDNIELNPFDAPAYGFNQYNDQFGDYLSDNYLAAQRKLENSYLQQMLKLDREVLSVEDKISYDRFVYDRQIKLKGLNIPSYYLPLSHMIESFPNYFVDTGSGNSFQPFNTVTDYENWLKKSDGFALWVDRAINRMKQGQEKQIVLPQVLVDMIIPQLQSQLVASAQESDFWGPINHFPDTFTPNQRNDLTLAYKKKIEGVIMPAYRRLYEFLQNNYQGRDTTGMQDLPDGRQWYKYLVELNTTTTLSIEEIHKMGLDEVARIRMEMEKVKDQTGFSGTLREFFTYLDGDEFYWDDPEQLVNDYRVFGAKVDKVLPGYFNLMPKARYEIRPIPANLEATSPVAYYMPSSPDGSRPGVFYVNTKNQHKKWGLETLFLHEAVPGHHFQIAIAQELKDIPLFQRLYFYNAYAEGWALYVESIGRELGFETDPLQHFGMLNGEMYRAIRLVVDTGLHYKGWTVAEAEQYMLENSALGEEEAKTEVRRYLAIPGQALSYKIGQMTISGLRDKASKALGNRFDLRRFHDEILDSGALPMDILEVKIDNWIKSQQSQNNQRKQQLEQI